MEEIKSIIDDLGNDALEQSTKIAGAAVVSDSGNLMYQTSNFDVSNDTYAILNVMTGDSSYTSGGLEFNVVDRGTEGIIATNNAGMGHVLFVPFQGGVLVAYAMPQADTLKALDFLKPYAMRLKGKV